MKSIVPYTKEIAFSSKIAEICSISLEHELNVSNQEINGNFIITGEYKSHEVSVNKENFSYKLPFSVEVTDSIVKDSLEFEITDFTYEIQNENILKVNIEFSVSAQEEEKTLDDKIEEPLDREEMMEEVNTLFLDEGLEEKEEPLKNEGKEMEKQEERIDAESANLILDSASNKEDEYMTYFIHLVKQGDTIESICSEYQTDVMTLKNYNVMETLNVGDKIIIPKIDE